MHGFASSVGLGWHVFSVENVEVKGNSKEDTRATEDLLTISKNSVSLKGQDAGRNTGVLRAFADGISTAMKLVRMRMGANPNSFGGL